jgi:hypothetical protein
VGTDRLHVKRLPHFHSHFPSALYSSKTMPAGLAEALPRGSLDFVESSVLEAVVPAESVVDIGEELGAWDGTAKDGGSILPFIKQRQVLLFGVYIAAAHLG